MDNSEFGENLDFFALTDIVPLDNNGTTSDTYKVRISGKWHFLKRPKQEFTNHPQYNAAFEKEFDIGYTLDHPNIVRYISKGKDKNGFYFLTEYVDGQTFQLIYILFMRAIGKTTFFRNLLFCTRKEEISKNRLRLGVGILSPECTFVLKLKNHLA